MAEAEVMHMFGHYETNIIGFDRLIQEVEKGRVVFHAYNVLLHFHS